MLNLNAEGCSQLNDGISHRTDEVTIETTHQALLLTCCDAERGQS